MQLVLSMCCSVAFPVAQDAVREFFADCGTIADVRIATDPYNNYRPKVLQRWHRNCAALRFRVPSPRSGFAAACLRLLPLHGPPLAEKAAAALPSRPPPTHAPHPPSHLPSLETLQGFAHIQFETLEGAAAALQKSGQSLLDREVFIDTTTERAPREQREPRESPVALVVPGAGGCAWFLPGGGVVDTPPPGAICCSRSSLPAVLIG